MALPAYVDTVLTTGSRWTPSVVLAATALDAPSAIAIRRAWELARTLGCRLRVIHVVTQPPPRTAAVVRTVVEWTAAECKIALEAKHVLVRSDVTWLAIDAAAREVDADLVVVGRSPRGQIVKELSRHHRVFAAAKRRPTREIVAATDFKHPELPVVRCAERIAEVTGSTLTVFHKPEPVLSLGSLAPLRVTQPESAASGILGLARKRDADVIAVGARLGHGATLAGILADEEPRSVLALPVG